MPSSTEPLPGGENVSDPSLPLIQDLLDFVIRYETDRMRGSVLTLPEYQTLFPRSRDAIANEFHSLEAAARDSETNDAPRQARLDHYILEREIGRGGQGRVYLALDTRMRRRVALKVLGHANLSPDSLRRFQREVEIIAKLDHPGLCSVFEANLNGPEPYLAMRYVEGDDLARKIRGAKTRSVESGIVGARTTVDLARLLQLFERVARALHAAHEAGVIHRDVKPANILVNSSGEPVIVDFGLARDGDPDADPLTQTDDVLGTPAYMAPELLESGHSSVDRRADVYALGVALYECLTLERPFAGSTRDGVFDQIRRGVYANPRARNALVGEDLRIVLAMAMEIDPDRRYGSALALAEDLRRVREYEPIRARPASWPIRLQRWAQRHPHLATSFALVLAVVGISLVMLTATVRRVQAESARTRAANERLRGVAFREQSNAALSSNAGFALRLAIEADKRDPRFESNMTLLRALESSHEVRSLSPGAGGNQPIYSACTNGDSAIVVTRAGIHFFEMESSKPRLSTPFQFTHPGGVRVAADSSRIAVLDGADVRVFDGHTGALLYTLTHPGTTTESCEFSHDSRWLVTSARDGVARIYEASGGTPARSLTPGTGVLTLARFDPSGRFILTTTDVRKDVDPTIPADFNPRLWNASTGEPVAVLAGHSSGIRGALFSADGQRLVTVCIDGSVRCWETSGATLSWIRMLPGEGWSLGVSPDGRWVIAGFASGARLFDLATGRVIFDLEGFQARPAMNLAFSPDGQRIAANDYGGGVGAWNVCDGSQVMTARCESTGAGGVEWLLDSMRFVTWAGGVAQVWTIQPIPLLTHWRSHTQRIRTCVFSPSSEQILSAAEDGPHRLHAAVDGRPIRVWGLGTPLERAWFVGDDESIACLARNGRVLRIDGEEKPVCIFPGAEFATVRSSELSHDGSTVLVGFDDGRVAWMEVRDGRTRFETCNNNVEVNVVAISLDGTRAAWCSDNGFGGAVDQASGRTFAFQLDAPTQHMHTLSFAVDGSRLVVDSDALMVSTIRFEDGARQEQHQTRPLAAIVPLRGGRMLTAFKWVSGVSLREASRDMELWTCSEFGAPGRFVTLRADATEELVLAASTAGFACLRRVVDGELLVRYEHGSSPLTCAEFSPDGRAVVTAAEDGSVHVWPIDLRGTALAHVPAPAEVWQHRFPKSIDED